MNSWATITALGQDLDSYLDTNYAGEVPIMDIEYDLRSVESMVSDKTIPGVRIALYEQPQDILSRVAGNKPFDFNQAYQMQFFFVVARVRDYDTLVEKELMEIKDHVYDWSIDIDVGSVTSNELLTWEWDGINRIDRQDTHSLMEVNFGAFRQTRL